MLIKRIALLVMIIMLSLSTSVLAAEPGSGVIEGRIVNGTAGGSSVADQDITLTTYLNEAEVDAITAKTDAEGRFVFDGLSTEPGYGYEVEITFQEAEYYSEWLSFDEGENSKSIGVTVYDATTSDEAIRVVTSHTVIYVDQGSLWFEEFFFFVNEADRTYIGSKEVTTDGRKETRRFSLPAEATEMQPGSGLMTCCVYDSEDGFVDTMPVFPGSSEAVYSYTVDYTSGSYTFSRRVNYPTTSFDLLVQGEGVKVASDRLIAGEAIDVDGIWFNHFSSQNLAPGDILTIQLSGLPESSNHGIVKWVTPVLIGLLAGAGFVYLMRKRRLQPVSPEDSLDQMRQRLLVELAQLDDDFGSGKIPEESYRRLRAERKQQLVELMQGAGEERGEG